MPLISNPELPGSALLPQSASAGQEPSKLAEQVASRLEKKIVDSGWPIGEVIGSERELLAELKISRAVFREAVRLLEHHSVAKMRRGPGGGLVVTEPETSSIARAATLHLLFKQATLQNIFEARTALELKVVELAAARIDEAGIERLREALTQESAIQDTAHQLGTHDLHLVIAELSGNPAMRLFLDVLTQMTVPPRGQSKDVVHRRSREVRHAHEQIVEAIIRGDGAVARHRMYEHLRAMWQFIGRKN